VLPLVHSQQASGGLAVASLTSAVRSTPPPLTVAGRPLKINGDVGCAGTLDARVVFLFLCRDLEGSRRGWRGRRREGLRAAAQARRCRRRCRRWCRYLQ
jgi:hypothetical protein